LIFNQFQILNKPQIHIGLKDLLDFWKNGGRLAPVIMNYLFTLPALGFLLLAGNVIAQVKPKTANPVKIDPALIEDEPYRFNGVVEAGEGRGSGFCAWNVRTFFSAAHVVFNQGEWLAPPIWTPKVNAEAVDKTKSIQSRGYYRWAAYGDFASTGGLENEAFGQDAILAFAFKRLILGKPAKLNLNGLEDLQENRKTLITGYPGENAYLEKEITGLFLHETGPIATPYQKLEGNALQTTLVTTGRGNSGGPIWTRKDSKSKWQAAGILVGELPSETVVYAFSKNTSSLLRAVTPVIKRKINEPVSAGGVSSYSLFFPFRKDTAIPDGASEWTAIPIKVKGFNSYDKVKEMRLSLDIRTKHRGDLQISIQAPSGFGVGIFNENGAGADNLIVRDLDYSETFKDAPPNGTWKLLVRDRLKGDKTVVKEIILEIAVEEGVPPIITFPNAP
jgi:Proprotein convertase P-domain